MPSKQYVFWAFFLGLWLGLLLECDTLHAQTDAMARPPVAIGKSITYEELASYRGFTFCFNEQPISFIRIGQDDTTAQEVTAHELKHQDQYKRYDKCATFDVAYRSALGFLTYEAEAYMAGYCAVRSEIADTVHARKLIEDQLYSSFGAGTIREEITAAMDRFPCKEPT
jgi:hypothetical protein